MSQTHQLLVVPLSEGSHNVRIASTVTSVYDARIEDGYITFGAGPDYMGARYIKRQVVVSDREPTGVGNYRSAGMVLVGGNLVSVWDQMPD